jgi:hypothetical protein
MQSIHFPGRDVGGDKVSYRRVIQEYFKKGKNNADNSLAIDLFFLCWAYYFQVTHREIV